MSYVTLGSPRFTISQTGNGETLVIPSQKNIVIVVLLSFWLVGWTLGGISAAQSMFNEFQPFIAVWLCAWAIGWLLVSFILSWKLTGKQRLRFVGPDLEIETSVLWFNKKASFRGSDVRGLKVFADGTYWQGHRMPPMPLLGASRGSVQFNYGARTHSTGFGLGELEALAIIDWLWNKLPKASV